MESPLPKAYSLPWQSNCREPQRKCPQSTDSTENSSSFDQCPHLAKAQEIYQGFKRKLLRAMESLDPLDILQSGIFQEYELSFNCHSHFQIRSKVKQGLKKQVFSRVSDFQSVLRSYEVSRDCKIIQLQKRSHSCDTKQQQKRRQYRDEELKNVEFVLWSNSLMQINRFQQQSQDTLTPQENLRNIKDSRAKYDIHKQIQILREEVNIKEQENSRLKQKLQETEAAHLRKGSTIMNNQIDDHRLQYLLKQKQLQKKLQEARDEVEQLRNLLEMANQQSAKSSYSQISMPVQEKALKDPLSMLRDKVENEGRVRRALQQLWGNELQNECNEGSQ